VVTEKKGRTRECLLGPEQLDDAARWIETYRRGWERRLDGSGPTWNGRREHLGEPGPATGARVRRQPGG
jgi:hypothetical protein